MKTAQAKSTRSSQVSEDIQKLQSYEAGPSKERPQFEQSLVMVCKSSWKGRLQQQQRAVFLQQAAEVDMERFERLQSDAFNSSCVPNQAPPQQKHWICLEYQNDFQSGQGLDEWPRVRRMALAHKMVHAAFLCVKGSHRPACQKDFRTHYKVAGHLKSDKRCFPKWRYH